MWPLLTAGPSGWERWKGQLQEAPGRSLLTQTAPRRRTAPGGRRLARTHTWTCSAVQKCRKNQAVRVGVGVGVSGTCHSACLHGFGRPQWPPPLNQHSGQITGAPQGPLPWSPEVFFCVILTGFHKETSLPMGRSMERQNPK